MTYTENIITENLNGVVRTAYLNRLEQIRKFSHISVFVIAVHSDYCYYNFNMKIQALGLYMLIFLY